MGVNYKGSKMVLDKEICKCLNCPYLVKNGGYIGGVGNVPDGICGKALALKKEKAKVCIYRTSMVEIKLED